MPGFGVERPRELGWQGVFRLPPGHRPGDEPELVVDRYLLSMPNGLCFSPDETLLYVNDTEQANIRVFDVGGGGKLSNGRVFAAGIRDSLKPGVPDGMKCDAEGNVWVTAPGRPLGLCAFGQAAGQGRDPRACGEPALGRGGLADALRGGHHLRLRCADEDRAAQRALHAGAPARRHVGGARARWRDAEPLSRSTPVGAAR